MSADYIPGSHTAKMSKLIDKLALAAITTHDVARYLRAATEPVTAADIARGLMAPASAVMTRLKDMQSDGMAEAMGHTSDNETLWRITE